MYHINSDQRAIRSCEMLYDGLAKLLREKAFDAISVTELVHVAQVGRATFYRNFDYIEDILRLRCDQVLDGMLDYFREYRQQQDLAHSDVLRPVLRYFDGHSELLELLVLAKRMHIFEEAFRNLLQPFRTMIGAFYSVEDDYIDYVVAMRVGGLTSVLTNWIKSGRKQAPDELADKLGALVSTMVAIDQLL